MGGSKSCKPQKQSPAGRLTNQLLPSLRPVCTGFDRMNVKVLGRGEAKARFCAALTDAPSPGRSPPTARRRRTPTTSDIC